MRRIHRQPGPRRGFTLVELLVSVALVVLMMTMFAEIFGLASNAVSAQKGAAVNDQKVRTFTTLIQNDIDTRTFRTVMPFAPIAAGAEADAFKRDFDPQSKLARDRQGYFAISENDPSDPTDDVLAFTVQVNQDVHGYRDAILHGKAVPKDSSDNYVYNAADYPPDQPEFDDGGRNNGRGASPMAEVAYFLRNGNLYRSVMLIRAPHSPPVRPDRQPSNAAGTLLFDNAERMFWANFDYSAFRRPGTPPADVVTFHTVASLNNAYDGSSLMPLPSPPYPPNTNVPPSLGIPHFRWGHTVEGNGGSGVPDEFVTNGTGQQFIGRFLKQEMADEDFEYPGINSASPAAPAVASWDASTGLVKPYDDQLGAPRRGEELLVPNVHEFDIQVWDDGVMPPEWRDIGAQTGGFYGTLNNKNAIYSATGRYRFDTWHPQLGDDAPFRGFVGPSTTPPTTSPDGRPGKADWDDDGDGIIDYTGDTNGNGVQDMGENWVWDLDEEGWIGTDDERPLRQIRIRVRFYDIKSGQVRQLTLTFPLIDNGGLTTGA